MGVYPELYGTSLTCIDSLNGGVTCQVRNLVAGTLAKIRLACFCLRESCLQPYWVLTSCIDSLPPTCVDKTYYFSATYYLHVPHRCSFTHGNGGVHNKNVL